MNDRHTILIVEDDDQWQGVLREPLEDEGYSVTVIADYQDSRQVLEEHVFDLVILDLLLDKSAPMLGGERLLAHISRRYPGTACIIVSGRGDTRLVRDAFKQHHVVDFIDKDRFDILTFIDAVKAALEHDQVDVAHNGSTQAISLATLRRILNEKFDLQEVKNLCFDLGVDFDDLPGEGKKTREIVAHCQRRSRLEELVASIASARPELLERMTPAAGQSSHPT
ncbi:MAG: hypothetical protein DRJ03_08790 [Chloroflexi bacterium]|nr:MAG: hypothetical protein B6I35_04920 [Anaerolineaceae bacterium 4572_32.2]RLC82312.1 MAG: hypothetical protein DRI81_00155 [Chloroflexota bacterium]RLC86435.1 MAG: hypothetical protein DRJ03_08790 [Chloroflexota bacterium]HEY72450.1 response regulator [Thermoflexia bacterium]